MILPIPGGVTSSIPVSMLALNADVQPDGCHGNRFRAPPGAFVAFQLVCDVKFLAGDTVHGFLLLGTLALEAPAVQEVKQSVLFNVCPESREHHGEKTRALLV